MADDSSGSRETLLARLEQTFVARRDPVKAGPMVAYMRHQFPFLGIPAPLQRQLTRQITAGLPNPTEADLSEVAAACWALPEREYQHFAVGYLRRWTPRLPASARFITTAKTLLTTKSWWDTVDELAVHVVGPLVAEHPKLVTTMDAWIGDDNIWLARTAILHQERYQQRTDADRLFGYCLARAADREFFIRKAIGWSLRSYSKSDAEAVRRFVADHRDVLSPLSQQEALRRINRPR